MTAQTFIFVHDQQIVLDYIAAGKGYQAIKSQLI